MVLQNLHGHWATHRGPDTNNQTYFKIADTAIPNLVIRRPSMVQIQTVKHDVNIADTAVPNLVIGRPGMVQLGRE